MPGMFLFAKHAAEGKIGVQRTIGVHRCQTCLMGKQMPRHPRVHTERLALSRDGEIPR